jgi:hypothetical protein
MGLLDLFSKGRLLGNDIGAGPQSMPTERSVNQYSGGGLIGNLMGLNGNPFYDAFNDNRGKISSAFGGMVGSGNDPRQAMIGLANGLEHGRSIDEENAIIRQQEAERKAAMDKEARNQNATILQLQRDGREDLVQFVNAGGSLDKAWGTYLTDKAAADKAAQEASRRQANLPFNTDPVLAAAYESGEIDFGTAYKQMSGGGDTSYSQTPVFLEDAEGNQQIAQMSSSGGLYVNGKSLPGVPQGWKITNRPAPFTFQDMGGYLAAGDPNNGTIAPIAPMQGAPSANMDVAMNPDNTRTMTPAAGSPQAVEQTGNRVKAESALASLELKNKVVTDKIDQALNQSGMWTTGVLGAMGTALPGSPAYDLRETLKTIKANIGFEELQLMRDNSPTGGALGSITERELAFLQSTVASIEQAQSEAQLRDNLVMLRQYLAMSAAQRRQAFGSQFGTEPTIGAGNAGGGGSMLPDPFGMR